MHHIDGFILVFVRVYCIFTHRHSSFSPRFTIDSWFWKLRITIPLMNKVEAIDFESLTLTTQPSQTYIWVYFIITHQHLLVILDLQEILYSLLEDKYSSRRNLSEIDTNQFLTSNHALTIGFKSTYSMPNRFQVYRLQHSVNSTYTGL